MLSFYHFQSWHIFFDLFGHLFDSLLDLVFGHLRNHRLSEAAWLWGLNTSKIILKDGGVNEASCFLENNLEVVSDFGIWFVLIQLFSEATLAWTAASTLQQQPSDSVV